MLTTLILLLGLVGLTLTLFLIFSGVEENETWVARTRRRVRREGAEVRQAGEGNAGDVRRERLERERIERRLERERARATLQDPE